MAVKVVNHVPNNMAEPTDGDEAIVREAAESKEYHQGPEGKLQWTEAPATDINGTCARDDKCAEVPPRRLLEQRAQGNKCDGNHGGSNDFGDTHGAISGNEHRFSSSYSYVEWMFRIEPRTAVISVTQIPRIFCKAFKLQCKINPHAAIDRQDALPRTLETTACPICATTLRIRSRRGANRCGQSRSGGTPDLLPRECEPE